MFDLGTKEILIIAVIVVLLFGSKKIPEITKSLADAIRHITGAFNGDASNDSSKVLTKRK